MGRDPCRTPMQWGPQPNAGFSPAGTAAPWLPLAANYRGVNVEVQLADPRSLLNLYRRLLACRQETPALQSGSYRALKEVPEDCYAFLREMDDHRVLIALNFSGREQRILLPGLGDGTLLASTHMDREGKVSLADLVLRGNEGLLVELPAQ